MLECVRCGITQNLISHDFTYDILPLLSKDRLTYGRFNYFTRKIKESLHSIPISVCRNCKNLFDKWLSIENLIFIIGSIEFVLVLIFSIGSILSIFFGAGHLSFLGTDLGFISPLIFIINFFIFFVLFLISIIWYLVHKQKDTNPRRYIRVGTGVVPFVRPHNYPAWIDYNDWVSALGPKPVQPAKIVVKKADPFSKFEENIYQLLKKNSGKAFTINAIMNRLDDQLTNESEKKFLRKNCEEILNKMSHKKIIEVVVKRGEIYYVSA